MRLECLLPRYLLLSIPTVDIVHPWLVAYGDLTKRLGALSRVCWRFRYVLESCILCELDMSNNVHVLHQKNQCRPIIAERYLEVGSVGSLAIGKKKSCLSALGSIWYRIV